MTNESRADTLLHFLRRRGLGTLSMVTEHLNNGTSQKAIAIMLHMDEGHLSRFISAVFVREYRIAPDIADMIELFEQLEKRNGERAKGNVYGMGELSGNSPATNRGGEHPALSRATRMLPVFVVGYRLIVGIECARDFVLSAGAVC